MAWAGTAKIVGYVKPDRQPTDAIVYRLVSMNVEDNSGYQIYSTLDDDEAVALGYLAKAFQEPIGEDNISVFLVMPSGNPTVVCVATGRKSPRYRLTSAEGYRCLRLILSYTNNYLDKDPMEILQYANDTETQAKARHFRDILEKIGYIFED